MARNDRHLGRHETYGTFPQWLEGEGVAGLYPDLSGSLRPTYANPLTERIAENPAMNIFTDSRKMLSQGGGPGVIDWAMLGLSAIPPARMAVSVVPKLAGKHVSSTPGTSVYHGTRNVFDKPQLSRVGGVGGETGGITGLKGQPGLYGEGFNVSESPVIAKGYGENLARRQLSSDKWHWKNAPAYLRRLITGGGKFRVMKEGEGRRLRHIESGMTSARPTRGYHTYEYKLPENSKFIDLDQKVKDLSKEAVDDLAQAINISEEYVKRGEIGWTAKDVIAAYGDDAAGEIWFRHQLRYMKPGFLKNHSGVKYTDKLYGFDKVDGPRVHAIPESLYPKGQSNYVITDQKLLDQMSPVRKSSGFSIMNFGKR